MKKPTYVPHLLTYLYAASHIYGKEVTDIGCGDGSGLQVLSNFAKRCVGVDLSPRGIKIAEMKKYLCPTTLVLGKIEDITEWTEVVVALETLEHLENPFGLQYIFDHGVKKVVFSVPFNYPHPLHTAVFTTEAEVLELFPARNVEIFYQSDFTITSSKPESFVRFIGIVT